MTNNNGNGTNAAASSWLGFSLSPHMASAMDEHHHVQQQQQHHHHHSLFFPSVTAAAAAAYGLGGSDGGVATSASPYYTPQLASMPLKSDGSLCIMEALRRSDQPDHHGTYMQSSISSYATELMAGRPAGVGTPFRSWFDILFVGLRWPPSIDRRCYSSSIQGPSSRTSWARRRRSRRPWR